MFRVLLRTVLVSFLVSPLMGCGKYGRPLPPEVFGPAEVTDLAARNEGAGLLLSWRAPSKDVRSRELKSIDGYRVVRATLSVGGTGSAEPGQEQAKGAVSFEESAFIEDTHLAVLGKLRDAARAEGRNPRHVKGDPALTRFTFLDTTVKPGETYLYKVVPINQGGIEGLVREGVRVAFQRGESAVSAVPLSDLEGTLLETSVGDDALEVD
jgi:hypothetical protein